MSQDSFTFSCANCEEEFARADLHEVDSDEPSPMLGRLPSVVAPMTQPLQPMAREVVLLCGTCLAKR